MINLEKSSDFYVDIPESIIVSNHQFFNEIKQYSDLNNVPVYIINRPLTDRRYNYNIKNAFIILMPKHKLIFVNAGEEKSNFEDFILDFIEDAGSLSDKYEFKENLGRPRTWRRKYIYEINNINDDKFSSLESLISLQHDKRLSWECEQLLSLLLGSINDVSRIGKEPAETELDKIKKKIILFDAEQTRFIFKEPNNYSKEIRIQGLSGTGKTELLLNKIKELYTKPETPKIALSCHNKVLANSLRGRIPDFFDFMKIEQQIKWEDKLFCFHAWGSNSDKFSGLYRYICDFYDVPFFPYSRFNTFDKVCRITLDEIKKKTEENSEHKYAFDYILLDESQDFPNEFFELCNFVVKNKLYIAGDIFQSIFDTNLEKDRKVDYLLNKCYRTDPKTLMLSHSIGMGLFEKKKIRWLSKEEWEACGYLYSESNDYYQLRREPLRRFEDIDSLPFKIDFCSFNLPIVIDYIISTINVIRHSHSTVKPEDICIVFPVGNELYDYAYHIERAIKNKYGYSLNKAYESKSSMENNAIFLSNRNNVKGLEFAFVICIVPSLLTEKSKSNLVDRNSIYMSLTRSYVQSYLLLNSDDVYISENKNNIFSGGSKILEYGYIEEEIPSGDEILELHEELDALKSKPAITLADVLLKVFSKHNIEFSKRSSLANMIGEHESIKSGSWDEDLVDKLVVALNTIC